MIVYTGMGVRAFIAELWRYLFEVIYPKGQRDRFGIKNEEAC